MDGLYPGGPEKKKKKKEVSGLTATCVSESGNRGGAKKDPDVLPYARKYSKGLYSDFGVGLERKEGPRTREIRGGKKKTRVSHWNISEPREKEGGSDLGCTKWGPLDLTKGQSEGIGLTSMTRSLGRLLASCPRAVRSRLKRLLTGKGEKSGARLAWRREAPCTICLRGWQSAEKKKRRGLSRLEGEGG